MTIKAVVFDAFGTLCEIGDPRRPYVRLLRLAQPQPDRLEARAQLMSAPLSLRDAATALNVGLDGIDALERDLQAELASIRLYPEVPRVLRALRAQGYALAVASNLALPYAAPLQALLPFPLDAHAWSFEVGHVKPDPRLFDFVCRTLDVRPNEALMIGDTYADDYLGATRSGLAALHLDRGAQPRAGSIRSLDAVLEHLAIPLD
ncbi:HAD family hydrolase [Caballeronia sp. LZ032]|uniref:HAD family hydrolase n=1 Tax=Caballeronia sp. LZ032 TaxID=3038565 RepID=UPI0028633AA7|nr:HAD family hydrolase [Caballeronia sp. LZ032]MDR5880046.1 HAD family hydrolase [Caballeronia sp. LZ032]